MSDFLRKQGKSPNQHGERECGTNAPENEKKRVGQTQQIWMICPLYLYRKSTILSCDLPVSLTPKTLLLQCWCSCWCWNLKTRGLRLSFEGSQLIRLPYDPKKTGLQSCLILPRDFLSYSLLASFLLFISLLLSSEFDQSLVVMLQTAAPRCVWCCTHRVMQRERWGGGVGGGGAPPVGWPQGPLDHHIKKKQSRNNQTHN